VIILTEVHKEQQNQTIKIHKFAHNRHLRQWK